MPLVLCPDCQHQISSEAHACPACGRPTRGRSYLTLTAQLVIGGLVLVACFAWPPLFLVVVVLLIARLAARLVGRTGRGSGWEALATAGVIAALTITFMFAFSEFAFVVMVMGVAATGWLLAARFWVARSTA